MIPCMARMARFMFEGAPKRLPLELPEVLDSLRCARSSKPHGIGVLLAFAALVCARPVSAAPPWVDRPITLPRLVFAGDAGFGIAHQRFTRQDSTGGGLNLETGFGITDRVEIGLRTGLRFGHDGRALQADAFGRTLFTETYGTNGDAIANPELRVRWAVYRGPIVEVGLDGRLYMPVEQGSRAGVMFGVPLAFHVASFMRIDTGVYIP